MHLVLSYLIFRISQNQWNIWKMHCKFQILILFKKQVLYIFFEMSFELSWNMVKDYLEDQGFVDIKSPRAALKKAFETGMIEKGHVWMDLLLDRNLAAHTYDEKKATEMEQLMQNKYFPLMKALQSSFKKKIGEE